MQMEKLPIEFKEKWVAALRSGEYKQGRTKLHVGGTYCCLGVACHIAGITTDQMGDACSITSKVWKKTVPPMLIREFIDRGEPSETLEKMNDCGKSFHEIANWIEENL